MQAQIALSAADQTITIQTHMVPFEYRSTSVKESEEKKDALLTRKEENIYRTSE
jgi:hypothetical protein